MTDRTAHATTPTDESMMRRARAAGWLFIATFVTAIAGAALYDPVLNDADFILGGGDAPAVRLGALFEILLIVANIGTAVVLFPVLKRQNESLALGYVASRIVESTVIAVGLISLLSVLTLRSDLGVAADGSLGAIGQALVAVHDWTFLIGPGFCVGIGNGLILGYLMYRSGLVPPRMAMFGLVGGPLIFASSIAVLFGAYDQSGEVAFLFAVPEIIWEGSLGIYLASRGFRSVPIIAPRPVAPAN